MKTFTAATVVIKDHQPHPFNAGDAVPDWAADLVGEHITTDIDANTVIIPVPVPTSTTQDAASAAQEPAEAQEALALADSPSGPAEDQETSVLAGEIDSAAEADLDDDGEDESPAADDDVPDFTQPTPRRRAATRRKG